MAEILENKTFDEIGVGDSASLTRALRYEELETWAAVTGNVNLVDAVESAAREGIAQEGGAFGMWGTALFSTIVGTQLPGAGTQIRSVQRRLPPADRHRQRGDGDGHRDGEEPGRRLADPRLPLCRRHDGNEYITATAEVIAPTKKIREPIRRLPEVHLQREDRFSVLLDEAAVLEAMPTAVVHPCSDDALIGPIQAAERDLIKPILVGPEAKIRAIAEAEGLDISPYPLIDVAHSHQAAERAVAMVRAGEAEILMKGSLHTDELLHAVLQRDTGIRTERRLSHCFLLAVPTYARPFILTDAAINIAPDLTTKRDICQNAIDIARAMGIEQPKVAILAAVESVNPAMPATLDAAALCKMADRGQIKGAILDGPLAFDNAADEEAARTKGIVSPVAGKADILLVPDLEAGNMLAKQLIFMAHAEAAGIVAGAQVPIVLTSRADSVRTRLASCAVAALLVKAAREGDGRSQSRGALVMTQGILVINAGSSSIKFAGYRSAGAAEPEFLGKGQVEGLRTEPKFTCKDADGSLLGEHRWSAPITHSAALEYIIRLDRGERHRVCTSAQWVIGWCSAARPTPHRPSWTTGSSPRSKSSSPSSRYTCPTISPRFEP